MLPSQPPELQWGLVGNHHMNQQCQNASSKRDVLNQYRARIKRRKRGSDSANFRNSACKASRENHWHFSHLIISQFLMANISQSIKMPKLKIGEIASFFKYTFSLLLSICKW